MNNARGRRLFYVMNQHLLDGTADAHALYCIRNCWWLAKTRPDAQVSLLFPGRTDAREVTTHYGLPSLANLSYVGLPALRRSNGHAGLTINLVFYAAAAAHLARHARAGDWIATASFTKLFRFLMAQRTVRQRCHAIYEVHQLVLLDDGHPSARSSAEFATLSLADLLVTTTGPLRRVVEKHLPGRPVTTVGLACGFVPEDQPPLRSREIGEPFTLGYIGSLYDGQGVDWLVQHWAEISAAQPEPVALKIIGGTKSDVVKLRSLIAELQLRDVTCLGAISSAQLQPHLAGMDALIIPSLPVGRMPYVAITKAYDYLGLNRPVLASDIPSITEVLRPEESYSFCAGKPDSLATMLRTLLINPAEARRRTIEASTRATRTTWTTRSTQWWQAADDIS